MEDDRRFVTWGDERFDKAPPVKPVPAGTPKAAGDDRRFVSWADLPSGEESREQKLKGGLIGPMGATIINGALIGAGPKALAGVRAATSGMTYDEALKKERDQLEAFKGEHPFGSTVLEMGGGYGPIGTGLAATKAGVKAAAPKVAEWFANSGLGRYLATVAGGVGLGALYGANSAKEGQVLEEAKEGAIHGGIGTAAVVPVMKAIGAVGHVVGRALEPTKQTLFDALGVTNPTKAMQNALHKALADNGQNEESLLKAIKEAAQAHPEKQIVLGDFLPPSAMALLKSANNVSGPGHNTAKAFHEMRTSSMPDRAMDDISHTISDQPSEQMRKEATEAAFKRAKPLYDKFKDRGDVTDPEILDLFDPSKKGPGKFFKPFLDDVIATEESLAGLKMPDGSIRQGVTAKMTVKPDGTFDWQKVPSAEDLHTIKMRLDDIITRSLKPTAPSQVTFGGRNYSSQDLLALKKELTSRIDKFAPEYGEARKIISGDWQIDKGFDFGKNIFKMKPDEFGAQFEKLNDAGKAGARAGVASLLTDKALGTGDTASKNQRLIEWMYGTPKVRRALEHVFETPEQMQKYVSANELEKLMAQHSKAVEMGFKNPDLGMAERGAGDIPALVASAAAGRTGMVIGGVKSLIGNEAKRMTPAYADVMSNIGLMSPTKAEEYLAPIIAAENSPLRKAAQGGLSVLRGVYNTGKQVTPVVLGAGITRNEGPISAYKEEQ